MYPLYQQTIEIFTNHHHHALSILSIFCYLNYPKKMTIHPQSLYIFSILHNTLLAVFSGYTCLSLLNVLYEKGIVFNHHYYFSEKRFDDLMFYFYVSKYYEYIDTFLIYLQGKQPIFLQKYHHIGAVLSWHLMYYYKVDMIMSASLLNSFVHSIMYTYYLASILKINYIKKIKKIITTLQLIQFFVLYSNFYLYRPPIETVFNYGIINLFALYGLGVIYLFLDFYNREYMKSTQIVKNKI